MQTPSLPLRSALAALVAAALGCANPAPEPSSVEGPVFVDVDPLGDVARRGEAVTVSEVPDCGPWSSSPDDGWCSWTNLVSGRADTAPAFDLTVRDTPSLATQAGQSFRARGIGWPAAIHLQLRKDSVSTDTGDFTVSVRAFGRSFGRGTLLARGSIPLESIPSDWTSVRIPLTLMAANGRVSQSEPAGYAWTAEVTRGGYGAVHVGALSELAQPYRYGNAFVGVQRRRSRVSWATSPTDLQFALVTDGRPLPSCSNGTADGDEADVDCGEACAAPCGKGLRCRTGSDCASGFECSGGVCAVEPCANGRMDGTEADVDCGGRCVDGESGGCGAGMLCRLDRDCESHNCLAGVCAALDRDAALGAAPADGGPTGVDEGAACAAEGAVQTRDIGLPPCVKTLAAGGFAGCTSGTQGCGAACGGLYLPPCRTAALCQTASDCDSGRCRRVSGSKPVVYRCAVATCSDGAKSTREAAKDCGEACDVNGDEKRCSGATPTSKVVCRTHLDCPVSNFCVNGLCAATPPVYDGIQNGSETAIDCGGGVAPACASGLPCGAHADCAAGYCDPVNRVCGSGTCSDQLRDGDETAVDCGGTCARDQARRCAVAAACLFASDCTSGVCTKGKCAPSTGKDGVRNGDESDVDCGGAGLTKCAVGKGCSRDDQCLTGVCRAGSGTCVAPSAFDGIRNGTETGIDCGGRSAPPCAVDVACGTATDCLSGNCDRTTKTCKACTGGTCQVGAECALNADCQSKFCRTVSGAAKGVCEDATCLKAGACGGKCAVPCDQTSEGTCPADQVYKASGVVRCHLYDDRAAGTAAPLATSCASGKLWPAATLPAVGRAGYCVVTCKVHADCASGRCAKTGACEPTTAASVEWCEDGVQDGLETAVDCGSACGVACAVGAGCRSDADCSDPTTSGVCVRGRCAAASCFDGLPGRGEADVDCGGTCADANGVPVRCEAGRRCTIGADCASGRCENGTCARESLQNYLRDGDESDIDCGGTSGRRCAEGRTCRVKGDCRYGAACVRGLCACPEGETCRDSDPNPAATAGPAAELARACRAVGQVCPLSGGGSGRCAAVGDGACRPVANLDEDRRCLTSADCLASFDPCEAPRGRCVAGVCRFSKVPEGTPCDDGDECTAADQTTCTAAGACVQVSGGTPVTHEEPAACASDASGGRLYGVCLRTNGSGVDVPAAKGETGASCRPGCWVGDALKAPGDESLGKVCRPELAATGWSLSSAACSSENASGQSPSALEADCRLDGYWDWRADASGGNQAVCVQAFAPAGTPCSRTGGGRCTAGAAPTCEAFCTIEDVVAQPKNAYFRGESNRENSCEECRPATSDKAWSAKAAGTTCDDGEASTYADRCVVSGAAAACSGTASSRDCPNELVPGTCLTQAHDGKGGCTPNGAVALPGAVCRAETEGGCDAAERCTGTAACPPDVVKAAGETCRAEAGACDAKEVCDGVNRTCPFDDYKLPGEASGTGVSCSGLGPGTDTASWRFFEASTSRLYLYKSTTGRPDIPETGALIKSAGDSIAVNWPMKNVSTGATMAALPNQDVFLAEVAQQGLPVPLWRRPDPAGKYPNAPFQFGARHRLGRDSSGNYLTPDWRAYGMVRYAEVVEIDHSLVNSAYPALLTGGSDIPNNWAFNVSGPTARSEQLQASGLGEGEAAPMEKLRLVYQSEPFERRFDLWSAFPVSGLGTSLFNYLLGSHPGDGIMATKVPYDIALGPKPVIVSVNPNGVERGGRNIPPNGPVLRDVSVPHASGTVDPADANEYDGPAWASVDESRFCVAVRKGGVTMQPEVDHVVDNIARRLRRQFEANLDQLTEKPFYFDYAYAPTRIDRMTNGCSYIQTKLNPNAQTNPSGLVREQFASLTDFQADELWARMFGVLRFSVETEKFMHFRQRRQQSDAWLGEWSVGYGQTKQVIYPDSNRMCCTGAECTKARVTPASGPGFHEVAQCAGVSAAVRYPSPTDPEFDPRYADAMFNGGRGAHTFDDYADYLCVPCPYPTEAQLRAQMPTGLDAGRRAAWEAMVGRVKKLRATQCRTDFREWMVRVEKARAETQFQGNSGMVKWADYVNGSLRSSMGDSSAGLIDGIVDCSWKDAPLSTPQKAALESSLAPLVGEACPPGTPLSQCYKYWGCLPPTPATTRAEWCAPPEARCKNTSGGIWVTATATCRTPESDCVAAGGTWDPGYPDECNVSCGYDSSYHRGLGCVNSYSYCIGTGGSWDWTTGCNYSP